MKFSTISLDAVTIISKFLKLQNKLITVLHQQYPQINDWQHLLDCPRSGSVLAQGEEWNFQRHGVGISFTGQESGKVVDAHIGLNEHPQAFDAWRLYQYFESIGIEEICHVSKVFEVTNEEKTENLLKHLLKDGLIAIASEQEKLYKLV